MHFQKHQLTNKTNIFLVPLKDAKSVTVLVMYPVGSRYETEKLSGVSHFIEHMMFKGTKKRPTTLDLTREIDRLGAEYNAFTSKEYTGYYIKTDGEFLEVSLDILSDMLFNSVFDLKEMEKEKCVIVEEIRMYNDNPIMHIESLFESLMYQGPLGWDTGGKEKTVASFRRDDVLKYRANYYQSQNMIVAVAGKINEKTKQLIQKFFDKKVESKKIKEGRYVTAKLGSSDKTKRIKLEQKKTDQAQLMIGFPGLNYNSVFNPTLAVLNIILGGSMSSRLFIQIRERRGLAYFVRSGAENFRDTGYFYVRAGLEAKNINKALQVTKSEMEKMISQGVTNKELADAKTHIHGALILSLEDSSVQANWYLRQALFMNEIKTPEEKLEEIDQVTNGDIKKLAKQIFDWSKLRVAVIGDTSSQEIKF